MFMKVLDGNQIAKVHETSLRMLNEIGVHIPHDDMRNRFRTAGASVDEATAIVRIPAELVDRSLATARKSFTIYGRDRNKTAIFGRGRRNYNSIFGEALWIDEKTGKRRYASLEDVATAARLGDALPNLSICGAMSDPHELPPSSRVVEVAATMLRHTTKPIGFWFHDRASTHYLIEIFIALAGSEADA